MGEAQTRPWQELLSQARERFFCGKNGGFICIGHRHEAPVLRKKTQIEQLLRAERFRLGIVFGRGIDHQLHAFYGQFAVGG